MRKRKKLSSPNRSRRTSRARRRKAMTTLEYALVDYDVRDVEHNKAVYPIIYHYMGPISIPYTESVDLVNIAYAHKVEEAFRKINSDLREKGLKEVEFHITEVAERAFEKVRNRSISSFKNLCSKIAQSLLDRIDRLEKRFNDKTDDVNEMLDKRNDAIAKARRELNEARGLAMIFLIEGEVKDAVESTHKIIEAQASLRDALKEQYADEIKRIREEKRKKSEAAKS
jgi:hypothetical protein